MTWQLLSEASSENGNPRWFEVKLFARPTEHPVHQSALTQYKVEMTGKSILPHETDRVRTEITTSPHAVIDFLAMGEAGKRYVPKVSRKALHEAGDIDQALADALDDFDSIVAR